MKKLVIFFILTLSVSVCFAKGQRDSFEFGYTYHHTINTQNNLDIELKTGLLPIAMNMAGITMYTDFFGMGSYANIAFPLGYTITADGYTESENKLSSNLIFSVDGFTGPVFMLFNNDKFCLPVSIGIHYYLIMVLEGIGYSFGLSANITGEYHINEQLYAYARFQFSYGFLGSQTMIISPCIGIAVKIQRSAD